MLLSARTSTLATELPWIGRVAVTILTAALSSTYVHQVVHRTRPTVKRCLLLVPVITTNFCLPLLFDTDKELLSRIAVAFVLTWLSSFKVVAALMDRGPFVGQRTAAQTAVLYMLPLYPKQAPRGKAAGRLADDAGGAQHLLLLAARNALILVTAAYLLLSLKLPPMPRHVAYIFGLYGFITLMMDSPAAAVSSALGMQLTPTFDEPWLSTSVGDFWGRRWNIPTASILRCCVYDPVMEGRLVALPLPRTKVGLARKAAAACATMAVSGVVHEIIFAYIAPIPPTGKWMAFFTMQGPLMLLEQQVVLKAAAQRGLQLPRVLSTLVTAAVMLPITSLLFFPPVEKHTDVGPRMAAAVAVHVRQMMAPLQSLRLSLPVMMSG